MTLRLVTYNIDGLPKSLDLRRLPWLLRPLAWVYRLLKGTYEVRVNDNDGVGDKIACMSRQLYELRPDIIAVQEDFNYHLQLMSWLNGYFSGTHTGCIDLRNVRWWPYPRCKADGLGLLVRQDMVMMDDERIVRWEKSHGYFGHANDKLTQKGFRRYTLTVADCVEIDVYVVHLDADYYHPVKCSDVNKDVAARRAQLRQLTEYILTRYDEGNDRPAIIMGDTNCNYDYEWDRELIEYYLLKPLYHIVEASRNYATCVDRLFVVNNPRSRYHLTVKSCYQDVAFRGLSDHLPVVAEIEVVAQ